MLYFNGKQYADDKFRYDFGDYLLVRINSPLDIDKYIENLRDNDESNGSVEVINMTTEKRVNVSNEELLLLLYANMSVCLRLLEIEEFKSKSIEELQSLSNQLPWTREANYTMSSQMSIEDVKTFFALNKYGQELLLESGFDEHSQVEIIKAMTKLRIEKKIQPEYTTALNTYLHNISRPSTMGNIDCFSSTIELYYKAPYLSECLIDAPDFMQKNYSYTLPYISNNEELRDALNILAKEQGVFDVWMEAVLSNIYYIAISKPSNYEEYRNIILYTQSEVFDNNENTFICHDLEKRLKDGQSDGYWSCQELGIGGKLNEPDIEKLQKFVLAINSKIMEISKESSIIDENLEMVNINNIDKDILAKLEENPTGLNDNFQNAMRQLLDKSQILTAYAFFPNIVLIEEHGQTFKIPEGEIFKCESSTKYHTVANFNSLDENDRIKIYCITSQYAPIRKPPYYTTTMDTAKAMNIQTLEDVKQKAFDMAILRDIKGMNYDTSHKDKARMRDMLPRKMYGLFGIEPIKEQYVELKDEFKKVFGRAPRIIPQIEKAMEGFSKEEREKFIKNFNYKNISRIIGEKTPIMIQLSSVFDWGQTPKGLQEMLKCYATSMNVDAIIKNKDLILECYKLTKERDTISFLNMIDRINPSKIDAINVKIEAKKNAQDNATKNALRNEIENDIQSLIIESKQEIGRLDAIQAEEEYGHQFINNSSALMGDNICVMADQYRMYFLNSLDYEHYSVGYDTSCCQHYGGAGEECVIAASSSPYCGTLVIKTHDGITKAQAFIWEALDKNGDKVLVLDNIEFANDREVKDYINILYAFCKESPYQTIHMGLSYNTITNIGIPISEFEMVNQPKVYALNDSFYSDYNEGIYLKKDGEVTFNATPKYYTQKFDTPSIIESTRLGVNLTQGSLIAQHYNVYYDDCNKTTKVINKDGEFIEPTKYPIYPFISTQVDTGNYIMRWDNIEPTDVAFTIYEVREHPVIIIKPIALDGETIPSLNEAQANALLQLKRNLEEEHPNTYIGIEASNGEIREINSIGMIINTINNDYFAYDTMIGKTLFYNELAPLPRFDGSDPLIDGYDDEEIEDDEFVEI